MKNENKDLESNYLTEIYNRIKNTFSKLRECINEREKFLLRILENVMEKKKQNEIINKMLNDINKIKEELNNNREDLNENYFLKYDKNMSNIIEDINNHKQEMKKNLDYEFIYEEKIFNDILNKIQNFGELNQIPKFSFKWKTGPNYSLSENNKIATKIRGEKIFNCNILGNIILPKNTICRWKIKLKKFTADAFLWNILIGVGPSNLNQNEMDLYKKTWTFLCGNSCISINSANFTNYKESRRLKEGEIVEVIMNTKNGELSFAVGEKNYGVACKIPLDIDLSPIVLIYEKGDSIELLN